MEESYWPALKAHVLTDERNRVRAIEHTDEYWESPEPTLGGLATAARYLRDVADKYEIPTIQFDNLESKVSYLEPREQAAEYRLSEEKKMFDSEVFGFYQTIHNVPVWQAGLKVTIKQGPNRVIMSEDSTQVEAQVGMPDETSIQRYQKILQAINVATMQKTVVQDRPELTSGPLSHPLPGVVQEDADDNVRQIRDIFGGARIRPIRGRFWIYRYNAEERLPRDIEIQAVSEAGPDRLQVPFLVPPVNRRIKSGNFYMVAEITFESPADIDCCVWRALVELETNSVLYLRPLSGFLNCMVYKTDPISKTGTTDPTSSSDNITLNPHRDDVKLENLYEPVGGKNYLKGTYVYVRQVEGPDISAPVEPIGNDFDYNVRTDHFASTSGYFHVDRIFRFMDYLGFNPMVYFSHTTFPIPVDIRCFNKIDAHCVDNGMGGIGHAGYGLMDEDTTNPLGRASDPRVHLHEILGHGVLYESVDSSNFHFAHSAGDVLSMISFDPESRCRGVDGTPVGKPGDLRFTYVPWHPNLNRRADRDVTAGWAWGGSYDNGGYLSEEILSTTLFNFYRSIGGDDPSAGNRSFASRMAMYLILRTISNLTPATNPRYARDFARNLIATDQLNWTAHGIFGGAYSKVIRWVFEQQGEYQTPLVTRGDLRFGKINGPGDPPKVDVYIDDGREGGYAFQRNFWSTRSVWNRHAPDGIHGHQNAKLGSINYAYARVKNRGTQTAKKVYVIGYHARPGAGLNWPADFQVMSTAFKGVGSLQGNNAQAAVIGPFKWIPAKNGFGFDTLLMVAGADGDMSNGVNFPIGESVPAWRLVPNDNNIAMRATAIVPLRDGEESLVDAVEGVTFTVQNPNPERERMTFEVSFPAFLRERGWNLELVDVGSGFYLPSGGKRDVCIKILPGRSFTQEEGEESGESSIEIAVLAGGKTIGGLTFCLEPDMLPSPRDMRPVQTRAKESTGRDSQVVDAAQRLAQCLGVTEDISKVDVKEIIVGLKIKESKE